MSAAKKPTGRGRPVPPPESEPVDPGFWRRPLSSRTVWLLIALAVVVVGAAIAVSLSLGVRLF